MSRVSLLPRLKAYGVDAILGAADDRAGGLERRIEFLEENSALVSFGASGGSRDADAAVAVTRQLRELARQCGYPERVPSESRARFDQLAAIALAQEPVLKTGEALRDDVWAFLAAVVAPDVVAWRFPDRASHRYAGGVRNAFQRLWARGTVLDRGEEHPERWGLVEALSEDAMVQIFERASLSGNERLARAIAELWVETAREIGRGSMEAVMRRATKLVRIRNEVIDLSVLPDPELREEVRSCFRRALSFSVESAQLRAG
jgi:hypothetical protein